MSKFTPWDIDFTEIDSGNPEQPYGGPIVIYERASGESICEMDELRGKEDAHLIAASPDLYAALKGLLAEYEFDEANPGRRKSFIAARLAIAKAEGV
jgi:hypothetical protein